MEQGQDLLRGGEGDVGAGSDRFRDLLRDLFLRGQELTGLFQAFQGYRFLGASGVGFCHNDVPRFIRFLFQADISL